MRKRIVAFISFFILIVVMVTIVEVFKTETTIKNPDKIQIVATLFPQYDFAKQIGGEKVDVTLLLTPGTETHTYEPTPQDIINVNNSDLFIYTGKIKLSPVIYLTNYTLS